MEKNQEGLKIEECGISLTAQNSRSHWCVDSEFSRHMTGNKNTFRSLQEKEETITFGNDNSSRKSNEPMERNNVKRMKSQRTSVEEQGHSHMWMKKTEQLHMGEDDHCKGDGCHMTSSF